MDYQNQQPDRFHHRYLYDADNRIIEVKTSADAADWHTDARYHYYPHGPLARVELGDHLVQGLDYAYTLQGWLKGINGDRLDPATDMGHDGDLGDADPSNDLVGHDAFALSLGYYGDSDYKAIHSAYDDDLSASIAQRPFAPMGTTGSLATAHKPLYNGNIAHTVNTLQPFGTWSANGGQAQVLAQVYAYDQLNRLKKSRGIIGLVGSNNWEGITDAESFRYQSLYEYDANGNITYCDRHDEEGLRYDALRYHYQLSGAGGRLLRNRLYLVKDSEADIEVTDIGDYPNHEPQFQDPYNAAGNINLLNSYSYDALGNLTKDATAGISAIDWTVAGKVKTVHRAGGSPLPKLNFGYGASGQRILKQVGQPGQDAGAYREHYIRDAQGNIMATYRYTNATAASLKLNERPLYGSSRLGSLRKEVEVYNAPTSVNPGANPVQLVDLNYELTDHLGNVSAVVTGRLLTNLFGATPCQAELVSATGYEAFGGVQTGRHWNSVVALNGFNGMRKENELNGEQGMAYDFGARMYDPRVGRWLTLDPMKKKFPWISPYAYAANNPVFLIDEEGNEPQPPQGPSRPPRPVLRPVYANGQPMTPRQGYDMQLRMQRKASAEQLSRQQAHYQKIVRPLSAKNSPESGFPIVGNPTPCSHLQLAVIDLLREVKQWIEILDYGTNIRGDGYTPTGNTTYELADPAAQAKLMNLNTLYWDEFYSRLKKAQGDADIINDPIKVTSAYLKIKDAMGKSPYEMLEDHVKVAEQNGEEAPIIETKRVNAPTIGPAR